jgi:hypothetical protein
MDDCAAMPKKGGQAAAQEEEDAHSGGSKATSAQTEPHPRIEEADNPALLGEYSSSDPADTTKAVVPTNRVSHGSVAASNISPLMM